MATIKYKLTFDVLIPTYNGASYITETIKSILGQSFPNFKIMICDDASSDNTLVIIKKINEPRIKIIENKTNLGYPLNLERGRGYCRSDILFLMGQDDILASDSLLKTYRAFINNPQIGALTRPYYWFDHNIKTPVRIKKQLNPLSDEIVDINDHPSRVIRVFDSLDQLSGLAYRRCFIDLPFHPDIFPCHVYPFASIFKQHPVMFLKNYTIAVRISSSQSRKVSSIYNKSPIQSWKEMDDQIFTGNQLKKIHNALLFDFIARNYIGLIQIRNYSTFKNFIRESYYLILYRWQNLYAPGFWFFFLLCLFIPPFFLIRLVDWYKNTIYSRQIKKLSFSYSFL